MAPMETGIQLHLPTYKEIPVPGLVALGKTARSAGVKQIWVTDNLQSRNSFVVLAALAANIPISLGTAVVVQYFRNPVDIADSVAAISEMLDGRELSIGLARGNPGTPGLVKTVKPVSMLRETAQCLHRLLSGEDVSFGQHPTLASYFNFNPGASFRLNFEPKAPIRLYCGGNAPLSLAVGGEFMDGLIVGGQFQAVASMGQLPSLLATFDDAASKAGKAEKLPKVAEIKISISRDRNAARRFATNSAGRRLLGVYRRGCTPEEILRLGVAPEELDRLHIADREGAPPTEFKRLVTDAMVDAVYVAGEPDYCRERMVEVGKTAEAHGFQQMMFSELGPNAEESLQLLCDEIIPGL